MALNPQGDSGARGFLQFRLSDALRTLAKSTGFARDVRRRVRKRTVGSRGGGIIGQRPAYALT